MRRPRRPRSLSGEEARLWAEIAKLITPLRGRTRPRAEAPAKVAAEVAAKADPAKPSVGAIAKSSVRMPVRPAPGSPPAAGALVREFARELGQEQAEAPTRPAKAAPGRANAGPKNPPKPAPRKGATPPPPSVAPRLPTAAPYQAPPQVPRLPAGLERQARLALRRGTLAVEARIDLHGMIQSEAHAALSGFLMRASAAGHAHVLVVTGKGGGKGGKGGDVADPFSERGVLRRSVPHWLRGPDLRGLVLGFEEAARHHGGGGALYVRLRRR